LEAINGIQELNYEKAGILQMGCRAFLVFFISLLYVRIAGLRTLGKKSSFDQITVLIVGSLLAKAIVEEKFIAILGAALLIMILHRFMAWISTKNLKIERAIKGDPLLLMKDGMPVLRNLKKAHITELDLRETIRLIVHNENVKM
jgi:uncharacterized membrane protein YcaP (DUF421 family)